MNLNIAHYYQPCWEDLLNFNNPEISALGKVKKFIVHSEQPTAYTWSLFQAPVQEEQSVDSLKDFISTKTKYRQLSDLKPTIVNLVYDAKKSVKYQTLEKLYADEKIKYGHYITDIKTIADFMASKLFFLIKEMDYEKISVELTQDKSLFLKVLINKTFKVHIEVYLNKTNDLDENTFFAIYKDKICLNNGYGTLHDAIDDIQEYTKDFIF